MYAGKLCALMLKNKVAATLIKEGYYRHYPELAPETKLQLEKLHGDFEADFDIAKARTNKIASNHELYKRLSGIKGISGYQIALLMAYVKDISRFDTPSKLCVYAGMASINGKPVTKANINKIKDERFETTGKEFKGFNTVLSGRMFVIVDCLLRGKGFFFNYYTGIRKRLQERAMNNGECELIGDKYYMKDRKNFSLILWSDKNAKRRIARTFLHIFWLEWRKIMDLPIRHPYVVDYLGHNSTVTLEEIIKADLVKAPRKPRVKKEDTPESKE
jgi:hypothetical protein